MQEREIKTVVVTGVSSGIGWSAEMANVRYGSKADIARLGHEVGWKDADCRVRFLNVASRSRRLVSQPAGINPAGEGLAVRKRLGENIDSEWERDPYADRVWDALQLIKTESEQGLAALLDLGAKGSSLALVFAAHHYRDGINNVPKNEETAIGLLNKSLDLGSIEGGYLLAHLHISNQRYKDGADAYNKIIDLGYSPAMYSLGYYYLFGDPSIRNFEKGAELFERAACIGHFHAKLQFANLLIRRGTMHGFLKGLFIKITSVIPYLYFRSNYPNSDRLRA